MPQSIAPLTRSLSSLGRATRWVFLVAAVLTLVLALMGWVTQNDDFAVGAFCCAVFAIGNWLSRVRMIPLDGQGVAFRQYGATFTIHAADVEQVIIGSHDFAPFGGQIWNGPGNWSLGSGGPYIEVHHREGRVLYASCQDPAAVKQALMQ